MNEITDRDVADADAMYQQWVTAIEHNPAALRELTDKFFVLWQQYNAVRDKLDAVPVEAILYMLDPWTHETSQAGADAHWQQLTAWAKGQEQQAVSA